MKLRRGSRYKTLNTIEINRQRMLDNVRLLQAQYPDQAVIPVLKSNAYGHGLREVVSILNNANVPFLAVDGYFEAARIRRITKHRLLVMGYIDPANVSLLDTKHCSFVLQDIASLEAFGKLKRRVRVHLELDTGMNRLGLKPFELAPYLEALARYPNLKLEGVLSHLADADNPHNDFTAQQATAFDQVVEQIKNAGFEPKYIHLAQTAGSSKIQSKYANTMRLGIGLYGINPLSPNDPYYAQLQKLQPVMELKSTIIKIHDLRAGDKVSYNGIFIAKEEMRIAILPLGYYEGLPRELSNQPPIVGRVCMNHTMINITGSDYKVGDVVTVISNDPTQPNSVNGQQTQFGIFSYNTLANVAESMRRNII